MCHLRQFRAVASFPQQRLLFTTASQMQQTVRAVAFLLMTFRDRNTNSFKNIPLSCIKPIEKGLNKNDRKKNIDEISRLIARLMNRVR